MLFVTQAAKVRVWDPFVRLSHWLLAGAVLVAWATDEPLWLHSYLGYLAAILVVLRVAWGFVGPSTRVLSISYAGQSWSSTTSPA
jgi:cytochrome b